MNEAETTPAASDAANLSGAKTRVIKAPSGKEVEIKNFLNVREKNALKKAFYGGISIEASKITGAADEEAVSKQHMNGSILIEVEEKMVELSVVRYGENRETPAAEIMNSEDSADYAAIVKELEGFAQDLFRQPSK